LQKLQRYKKTRFGEIPQEWSVISLDHICRNITDGKHGDCQNERDSGYYFVSAKDIIDGQIHYETARQITKQDFLEANKRTKVEPEDILLTNSGTIGKLAIVKNIPNTPKPTFQKSVAILKPMMDRVSTNYLYYALLHNQKQLENASAGSSQRNLLLRTLKKFNVKIPSTLDEQNRIASILSRVDDLTQKIDQIIEQTQRLKKGLMQKLLTRGSGHKKLKSYSDFMGTIHNTPEIWQIIRLEDLATIRYGLSQPPKVDGKGIPMIRATNIHRGTIVENGILRIDANSVPKTRDLYLHEGDIIVVRSGVYTGDIGYVTKEYDGAIAGYDLVVTPSESADPMFLMLFLLSSRVQNYFSQLKSRVAQEHLNSKQLGNTIIFLPPILEQKKISTIISSIENMIQKEIHYKHLIFDIKKGLMQNLLTGKTRVKV
jgi:type I restriction enzyme S subunit